MSVLSEGLIRSFSYVIAVFGLLGGSFIQPLSAGTQSPSRIPVQSSTENQRVTSLNSTANDSLKNKPFYRLAPSLLDDRDLAAYIANAPSAHYAANHERTLRQIGIALAVSLGIYIVRFIIIAIF